MSNGGWKKPLYQLEKFDSRNAADIGNKIGGKVGDFIESEGKQNTQNPGRGITKGLESLASWYLGGAAAGALGGGAGAAGSAAGNAAPLVAGAASDAGSVAGNQLMQQAAEQAAQQAAEQSAAQSAPQTGLLGNLFSRPLGPGGIPAAPGMAPQAAMDSANIAHQAGLTSNTQYAMDALKAKLMSAGSSLNTPKGQLMARTGMGLLQPPQQQQMAPQSPRPPQQIQPVPSPYAMQGPNTPSLMGMQQPGLGIPPGMTLQQYQELLRRQQQGY